MTLLIFAERLGVALLAGACVGLERQWRQRLAGLRTSSLVAAGAALFVLAPGLVASAPGDQARIAAQVVSGIGFLGAGVILRDGLNVRGLNTAATLWCTAGLGVLAGIGTPVAALIGAGAVVFVNLVLRPLARRIDRLPNAAAESPVCYTLSLICYAEQEAHLRALLLHAVSASGLTLRRLQSADTADPRRVEVRSELLSTGPQDGAVEQAVARLSLEPGVSAIRWEVGEARTAAADEDLPVLPWANG